MTLEKEVVVLSIVPINELETGDNIYQIAFGEYIDVNSQVIERIPILQRQGMGFGSKIGVNWVTLLLKSGEVPYKVGSKWKITILEDGTFSIVKV